MTIMQRCVIIGLQGTTYSYFWETIMSSFELLLDGMKYAKAGKKDQARELLIQFVNINDISDGWLWLSEVVESNEERRYCLERILKSNPSNEIAHKGLSLLPKGTQSIAPAGVSTQVATPTPPQLKLHALTIVESSVSTQVATPTLPQPSGGSNTAVRSTTTSVKPSFTKKAKPAKRGNRGWILTFSVLFVIGMVSVYYLEFYTDLIDIRGYFGTSEKESRHTVQAFIDVMTESATATAVASNIAGKWTLETATSSMNDTKVVFIYVDANDGFRFASRYIVPRLYSRCKENQLELLINIGVMPALKYSQINAAMYAQIQARFDKNPVSVMDMDLSTNNEALFFRSPLEMVNLMKNHTTLLVQFTPVGSSPETVKFDLTGIDKAIMPVLQECQIKLY